MYGCVLTCDPVAIDQAGLFESIQSFVLIAQQLQVEA